MRFPVVGSNGFSSKVAKQTCIVLAGAATLWLCGCGMGSIASPKTEAPLGAFRGQVKGGQQPISGGRVYLYKAGTTGYGSPATSIILSTGSNVHVDAANNYYVLTDANGMVNLTGDYSCAAGDEIYALSLGGNPGNSTGNQNSYIALMAGLGDCTFLQNNAANFSIQINELTTVASVFALQQFMVSGSAPSATNLGTSSASGGTGGLPGNAKGLQAAMAMINNLVDIGTGSVPGVGQPAAGGGYTALPSYETMTIPVSTINTLGNILAGCVNSDPTNGDAGCADLVAISKYGTTVPTDTVQAMFNIAQNPSTNVTALYNLESRFVQWTNHLSAAPNDWTLPVQVAGGGIAGAQTPAVDSQGNIWLPDDGNDNAVTEISPSGVLLSGATGYNSGPNPYMLAIDANDNVWMANIYTGKGSISYMTNAGVLQSIGSPAATRVTGCGIGTDGQAISHGLAIDGSGNIWDAVNSLGSGASNSSESINEFSNGSGHTIGTCIAGPLDSGSVTTSSGPNSVTFDPSGNMWVANKSGGSISLLSWNASNSTLSSLATFTSSSPLLSTPFNVAIDAGGNAWTANGITSGSLFKMTSAGTMTSYNGSSLSDAVYVTVDGQNNVWTANYANGCVSEFSNAGVQLSGVCLGKGTIPVNTPHGLAIDLSGNLWVGTSTVESGVFFLVGAAAPTVAPILTATVNNHLGVRP